MLLLIYYFKSLYKNVSRYFKIEVGEISGLGCCFASINHFDPFIFTVLNNSVVLGNTFYYSEFKFQFFMKIYNDLINGGSTFETHSQIIFL